MFLGQRCRGRNYDGRRCCTPENPCGEGEGDCDGAGDGGLNDGNFGCRGDLVCGSNNCKQFGAYYHEKDDCCERSATISVAKPIPRQQQQGQIHLILKFQPLVTVLPRLDPVEPVWPLLCLMWGWLESEDQEMCRQQVWISRLSQAGKTRENLFCPGL